MSIQELTERKTRNVRDVISTLKLLLKSWDDKATPRKPFKAIRWSLVCAIEMCEKQEPMKVHNLEYAVDVYGDCPRCGTHFHLDRNEVEDVNYCIKCGQRLDWNLYV